MNSRTLPAKATHEGFYQDLIDLLRRHAGHLPAEEMLAVAANAVGKIIAMQDQRTMTRERALQIVGKNIEAGNAQALEQVSNTKGSG